MRLLPFIAAISITTHLAAQNVGIGTSTPQNKLHVAGGIRVDGLAGTTGLIVNNSVGDFSSIPLTFNSTHVLKGNGSFGLAYGAVPASGLVASELYNNTTLISAGYSLIGELPSVIRYNTINSTFPANSWEPTYLRGIAANQSPPTYPVPGGQNQVIVWTGTIMYIWEFASIFSYNPDTDVWQRYPIDPSMAPVNSPQAVWTGSEIILWNGVNVTGYRFNPTTAIATTISIVNAPSPRVGYTMVWDGTRVIVWGGAAGVPNSLNTGAYYNPVTDVWTTMPVTGAPTARFWHTATWSTATNRMIVWGGSTGNSSGEFNTGGIYDPATNVWTGTTSTANAPSARNLHNAIWTGTEMIVVGGQTSGLPLNTGGKYNPVTNTWAATNTTGSPAISRAALAWTGAELYVSGGLLNGGSGSNSLLKYDPALNTWTAISSFSKGKFDHFCLYKNNMVMVWGGIENTLPATFSSNEGYRYFLSNTVSSSTRLDIRTLFLYQKL